MSVEALSWAFQQNITPAARKLVLLALANRADENGCCYPGYKRLAEQCSITRAAVIGHIKALADAGIVEKIAQKRRDGSDTSNLYRLKIEGGYKTYTRGSKSNTPGVKTLDPNYTNIETNKKNALPRADFLREIDKGRIDGAFSEWPHLSESEIAQAAAACLDFWGAKGEWPGGDPVAILRHWIRNGISRGKIRRPEPPREKNARQDAQAETAAPEITLSPVESVAWKNCQMAMKKRMGEAVFNSWLAALTFGGMADNGTATLYVPTRFMADWIAKHYADTVEEIISEEFGRRAAMRLLVGKAVYVQPTTEKEPAYV